MWAWNAQVLFRASEIVSAAASAGHQRLNDATRNRLVVQGVSRGYDMSAEEAAALIDANAGVVGLMLLASSIESLLKGRLAAKGIRLLDDKGAFVSKYATHKLLRLADEAGIALDDDERSTLEVLTHFGEWRGRYPIPKGTKASGDLRAKLAASPGDLVMRGRAIVARLAEDAGK